MKLARKALSRRDIFGLTAAGAAAVVVGPSASLATPEKVAEEIKKLFGDRKPGPGKIKLDLPVDLPRPREDEMRYTEHFRRLARKLKEAIE